MKLKEFFLDDKNVERNSYIWNMCGTMLMAFQSVIMLMILTRILGLTEAGILTIAYANANLFLNIGEYGMRFFQVSDLKKDFSRLDYLESRIFTSFLMLLVSALYILYSAKHNSYSLNKSLTIFWMCLFKVVDALEDVYIGEFQRKNRLDIVAKTMTVRMLLTIITFAVSLIIIKDLLLSLIISTIVTAAIFFLFTYWTVSIFPKVTFSIHISKIAKLLQLCFPLFVGKFLSFYIGNAPKYAIDALLSDELQACYGFIAMPVFVIGLLNNFIFNPSIHKLSTLWQKKKVSAFVKRILMQVGIVFSITVVCMAGAYVLGAPVLSILYNTDLFPYKNELLILLIGGGFLGLSGILSTAITIIRFQKSILLGYSIVAILALFLSNPVVKLYGITGASALYVLLMAFLCVMFSIFFIIGLNKEKAVEK